MRYWHIVQDEDGKIIEQYLIANDRPRFSMQCLAEIEKGQYNIILQEYKD